MLKVIFHVAAISITNIPCYLMAEASGDGKPLLKEPTGSAFLTAVVVCSF